MSDSEFLIWVHDRLKFKYKENELQDFMHKLRDLCTKAKESAKDKARLDWLADPNKKIGNVQLPVECVEKNLHSLRAAIDAAMEIKDE